MRAANPPIAPGRAIAIEAAIGAARNRNGEFHMATIGTFKRHAGRLAQDILGEVAQGAGKAHARPDMQIDGMGRGVVGQAWSPVMSSAFVRS
jgi:hypothetical protein